MISAIRSFNLPGETAMIDRALVLALAVAVVANGVCLLSYL
jgi:hypothetical protein